MCEELCEVADVEVRCEGGFSSHEGVVRYVADPFMEEIHNEIVMMWLCESCEHESAMDI